MVCSLLIDFPLLFPSVCAGMLLLDFIGQDSEETHIFIVGHA